ncbi:MAG: hypothetical protein K1X64_14800 [Myxococcaceae bacterium]|nr:hypothetical protein [Myxococcaceae bacterium]
MEGQKAYLSRALNRGMTPGGAFSLQRYLDQIPARLEDGRTAAYTLISYEKLALWSAARHTRSLEMRGAFQNIADTIGAKVDKLVAEKPYLKDTPSREWNPGWWKKWGSNQMPVSEPDWVELKAPPKK